MTLEIILWATAAAILFAISNAVSFKRGGLVGYDEGYQEGVQVKIEKVEKEVFVVKYGEREDEPK